MKIDHETYPIIAGSRYYNYSDDVYGILYSCDMKPEKNEADIEIKVENNHCYYKLNYSTFTMYWKLVK